MGGAPPEAGGRGPPLGGVARALLDRRQTTGEVAGDAEETDRLIRGGTPFPGAGGGQRVRDAGLRPRQGTGDVVMDRQFRGVLADP